MAIDISGAGRGAQFYSSHQFGTWKEAEKFFLDLGAAKDILDMAAEAMKENGIAKLAF